MTRVITRPDLRLFKIDVESRDYFVRARWTDISDFQNFALRLVGDVLRQPTSIHFWNDGCYTWYTDEKQDHEQRVWMTNNGIAMFEDCQTDELFRIEFNY